MVRGSPAVAVIGLPGLTTVALAVPEPSVTRAAKPMPTTSVAKTSATATTFRWVRRLAASSEKLFMTRSPAGEKKRAAGVVWVRRLVLSSSRVDWLAQPICQILHQIVSAVLHELFQLCFVGRLLPRGFYFPFRQFLATTRAPAEARGLASDAE